MADVTIRAVAPGECDVTVSSAADPSKSAKVHVTVEPSKNLLRWGPASTRVDSLGNTCEATVNDDGSLHLVAHVQTAKQTLVSWVLDPAALAGKAVYMSQTGADAAKLRVGVYGGSSFNLYADAAGTVPDGLGTLQLLVYAVEAGDYELNLRPQLEEGAAKTDWERPDDVSFGWGRNLWALPELPVTDNGVTFTATSSPATVHVSGKTVTSGAAYRRASATVALEAGEYELSVSRDEPDGSYFPFLAVCRAGEDPNHAGKPVLLSAGMDNTDPTTARATLDAGDYSLFVCLIYNTDYDGDVTASLVRVGDGSASSLVGEGTVGSMTVGE